MASSEITELTDQNFEGEVLKSSLPTLVDFWAVWCGPCRAITSTVEALAKDYQGKLKVGKLNIDDHKLVAQRYEIKSIPTLLLFKDGKVVGHLIGAHPRPKIEEIIKKAL